MNQHGDYETRFDILICAGNFSETSSSGPNFQFRDVNITNDLQLTGPNIPDTIGVGQNLRLVAKVEGFNGTRALLHGAGPNLFQVTPDCCPLTSPGLRTGHDPA